MDRKTGTRKDQSGLKVFGIRAVLEAIGSGKEIASLYVQKGIGGGLYQELREEALRHELPMQTVPPEKLFHLGDKNHQGVVAVISPVSFHRVHQVVPAIYERGEVPLLLVLDRITDVRNFGAIARSAECMGAHAIVIPSKGAAQVNADAVKTSAGALHKIPVCREKILKSSLVYLQECGLQIVACTEKAVNIPAAADLTVPTAIILGSEENGIQDDYLRMAGEMIRIPMQGSIASLNVSVVAGIVLYEVNRQRTLYPEP